MNNFFNFKKDKFRTLVLFIALIIVVMSLIFVTYKNYVLEEMLVDGKILCSQLMNAQITYYSEHGYYLLNNKVSFNSDFPIDAKTNPYFYTFSTYPMENNRQGISVYGSDTMDGYEIYLSFDADNPKTIPIKKLKMKVRKNF